MRKFPWAGYPPAVTLEILCLPKNNHKIYNENSCPRPRTQRLTRDREHQWPSRPPGTGTGALSLGVNLLSREGNSQKWRMKDNKSHFWRVTFTWVVGHKEFLGNPFPDSSELRPLRPKAKNLIL